MDLCVSCKACKSECPSNIDMSTLKAEFLFQYQKVNPVSLRSKLIAHNARINALAYRFSAFYNAIGKSSWFKTRYRSSPRKISSNPKINHIKTVVF